MESDHIFTREPSETDRPPAFRRPRIVPPVTWLAAAVLLIAAVGLCIWSFTGTIVRSVDITGIVFPQYGIEQVTSQAEGLVSYVQVEVGDTVQAGDLIAVVPQEELLREIEAARASQASQEALEALYQAYEAASMIYTPVSGRVVDLIQAGDLLQMGDLVAGITNYSVDSFNEAEIRAYVPSAMAQSAGWR